jgi:putative membrane protein
VDGAVADLVVEDLAAVGAAGQVVAVDSAVEVPVAVGKLLSKEDVIRLEETIAKAEKQTEGELVVVVASQSAHTNHVIALLILGWSAVFFGFWGVFHQNFLPSEELISGVVYFLGLGICFGLNRLDFVKRFLTSDRAEIMAVNAMAELEFHRRVNSKTHSETGVLIYLSLMERQAVILADDKIDKLVPKDYWQGIMQQMLSKIGDQGLASGLELGINLCMGVLHDKFPFKGQKKDQICNQIIFM